MPASGPVAVVTGGGTGIGFACAEALTEREWTVVIAGRRAGVLDSAAAALIERHPGAEICAIPTDVSDAEQASRLIKSTVDRYGRINSLICAAGVYDGASVTELRAEVWSHTVNIVLGGTAFTAFEAARHMQDNGGGRIVFISSMCASMSEAEQAPYNAAKAGVSSLARSMAVELSESGVQVNAVEPGWVQTAMTEEAITSISLETWRRISPIARAGKPEEIAHVVCYLATEAPAFLTGASVVVDGGQTIMAAMP